MKKEKLAQDEKLNSADYLSISIKKKSLFLGLIITLAVVVLLGLCVGIPLGIAGQKLYGTPSTEIWDSSKPFKDSDAITLYKDPNKDFKILNLTDVQMSTSYPIWQVNKNYNLIKELTEAEKPDLITLTGDNIWLLNTKSAAKKFVKEMDALGVPWAPVFGNHDAESDVDRNWLADTFLKSENCIMKKGPVNIDGVGNYIINIKDKASNQVVHTLFMMDSHDYNSYPAKKDATNVYPGAPNVKEAAGSSGILIKDGYSYKPLFDENGKPVVNAATGRQQYEVFGTNYDYIKQSQIDWYEWAVKGIQSINGSDSIVTSSAFFHIALPEFAYAYADYEKTILDENGKLLSEEKLQELEKNGAVNFGANREQVCAPYYNSGFFDVMKTLGSTKNVIVGHDHVNNSSIVYQGIRLTYALKTGDGCYWDKSGKVSGGTTITITADGSTTTKHIYREFK